MLSAKARGITSTEGSNEWYLVQSEVADRLRRYGRADEALEIYQSILQHLDPAAAYDRAATLVGLARCFTWGQPDVALRYLDQADEICAHAEHECLLPHLRSVIQSAKGDAFQASGRFPDARAAYEACLAMTPEIGGHPRDVVVTIGELATIAAQEGRLADAEQGRREALALFQELGEPQGEAGSLYELGWIYAEMQSWEEAERFYREAARIAEEYDLMDTLSLAWSELARVSRNAGRLDIAESWYRKAITAINDVKYLSFALTGLAHLLLAWPDRLSEARELAERALSLKESLDPRTAEIWMTHAVLADIAVSEGKNASDGGRRENLLLEAREHWRRARQSKLAFPGTRYELIRHAPLIQLTVLAVQQSDARRELEAELQFAIEHGAIHLADALQRILDGERNADELCASLDLEAATVIEVVLRGIANPSALDEFITNET